MAWTVEHALTEVRPGIFFVEGPAANWVIATEPGSRRFTLVDTGYPGDRDGLLASFAALGRDVADCAGLLVTHGHSDHIGSAAFLAAQGVPVFAHQRELANVRREITEQVTIADLGWRLLYPRVARWAVHALRAGGLAGVATPAVRAFGDGVTPAALPGAPEPILTGGHTAGHTGYLFRAAGVLASGDVVIGGHPLSPWSGPQYLPRQFHADPAGVPAAARALGTESVGCVLPGHGPWLDVPNGLAVGDVQPANYRPFTG
ncbi:MBL fold metallo-hydrolase [Specibacter cremeus]|uniref:MBL fold metallo-hydrolase n=1 Tax=Specibacter cremeus TaxID=1629051 RepID=UPI000F7A4121|nr:MBL fold metallo-hydrolase [Specibacter cremeus]